MKRAVLLESESQGTSPWVRVGDATEIVVQGMGKGDLLDFFFRRNGSRVQGVLSTHEDGRLEIKKGVTAVKAKHANATEESCVTVDLE